LAAANERERLAQRLAAQREQEARRERDETRKEKKRADENLLRAFKAAEDFCTNVVQDEQLHLADFSALRKQLLQSALPFFEDFVKQRSADPKLQLTRGGAYY